MFNVVMDATARLLAPRRSLLSSLLPRPAEKSQNQGKKKQSGPQKAKQVKAEESKKARQAKPEQVKKGRKPVQEKQAPLKKTEKKKGDSRPPRRDRRMPPEPPRKNQTKDSTEQASLMKPYYLDIGR